jgi:hypothetical protein
MLVSPTGIMVVSTSPYTPLVVARAGPTTLDLSAYPIDL